MLNNSSLTNDLLSLVILKTPHILYCALNRFLVSYLEAKSILAVCSMLEHQFSVLDKLSTAQDDTTQKLFIKIIGAMANHECLAPLLGS